MEKLLYLCTKHINLSFGARINIQVDGAAMGSPLGPALANIFMTELEILMTPSLGNYLQNCKRFVDDTFAFVLPDEIGYIVDQNVCSCHVTYAFQSESTPYSFLNVKELLARSRREI